MLQLGAQNEPGTITPINIGGFAMARRKKDDKTKDLFAYAEDNHRVSVVYMATNTVNGKRYIGITRLSLRTRWLSHLANVRFGSTLKFHNAIRKHGSDAFRLEIIQTCQTYQEAKRQEQCFIADLTPEYNLTRGGDGALGVRPSVRALEALRKRNAARNGVGWFTGKRHSEETRARISAIKKANPQRPWLGKKRDPETNRKISVAKAGKPLSTHARRANAGRRRPVLCITDGLVFPSPLDAAKFYGYGKTTVARNCRCASALIKLQKQFVYVEDWLL